jgi:cyclopropane fatty-acyl-phospholipid synthase-like methyltransferase
MPDTNPSPNLPLSLLTQELSERFPRSSTYRAELITECDMGPNVLWLTEFLCEAMDIKAGMRVLDLGCGKALSSIFLAKEFGVEVWATDLWITATENAQRIQNERMERHVFPIHADARNLPYAENYFDAILSVDAFEYFGTDGSFLGSLLKYLKPGCQIGVVNAGLIREVDALPKEWPDDFCTFHTPEWWKRHWEITRQAKVEVADQMPDGREIWMQWNKAMGITDDDYLTSSAGENLGIHRIVARRI